MGWVFLFVFLMLLITFLRNAPVVGSLIFKPLFDLIWIVVALGILGVGLFVAYVLTPAEYIPEPVHNAVENLSEWLEITSIEEFSSNIEESTASTDDVDTDNSHSVSSEVSSIQPKPEVLEIAPEGIEERPEQWHAIWRDAPIPADAPPDTLHLDLLYPDADPPEGIPSFPELTGKNVKLVKVKVRNVASDDVLNVRGLPHYEFPAESHSAIKYDAKDLVTSGCWDLGEQKFVAVSVWEHWVRNDTRKKGVWCFIRPTRTQNPGWVNSWYLELGQRFSVKVDEKSSSTFNISQKKQRSVSSPAVEPMSIEQKFNAWFLNNYRPRLETFQQMVLTAPDTALTINAMGLDNFTFGFMFAEIKLMQQNPSWTLQDIKIELKNQDRTFKNFYQIDMAIDEQLVELIYRSKLTKKYIKSKANLVVTLYNNCLQNNLKQRPSVRLSNKDAQKSCYESAIE